MEAQSIDLIEEFHSEDIMSVNHSRTIQRISVHFEQYDDEFDTFPELELKLNGKPVKPDIIKDPVIGIESPFTKIFRHLNR